MISTNDFFNGLTIELEGEIYTVIDFQHVKPGKGAAFVRSKLRNIRTRAIIERTFRAGEKVPRAYLERRQMDYLYSDGEDYFFMDAKTYDQISLSKEQLGDAFKYLKENIRINVLIYQGEPLGIELPNFVELKVVETEPGIRGDTASGGSKSATLETGLVIQVPFFINVGDILRIDTRTGEYIERV